MAKHVKVGDSTIGSGHPVYFIGEIGLNHNGSVDIAKKLIDVAVLAGCDSVKFQKRTPELCVPEEQKSITRETPWGVMSYLDYRKRIEFWEDEYAEIDTYCKKVKMDWFVSVWDEPSIDFIENFNPICHKVPSAALTHDLMLKKLKDTGRPVMLSTGMSTAEEIEHAVALLDQDNLFIAQSTSTYPCDPKELNLRHILTLDEKYPCPIGYSGHEIGLQTTIAAVAIGATFIERHITLDRAMWGSDQSTSLEPVGLTRLIRDIRIIGDAMGDGVKKVYESEQSSRDRLRQLF